MSFSCNFHEIFILFCIFAEKVNKVRSLQTAKAPSGVIPEGALFHNVIIS